MSDLNKVIRACVKEIISDENIPWMTLKDRTVIITGATGLVGGVLTRAFAAANMKFGLNMRLIAHGRDENKGSALSQEYGAEFIGEDIRKPLSDDKLPPSVDYIFHCAAVTKSADMLANPVDVITTSVRGTENMLELARERNCKSFVYLSSMEIYGQIESGEIKENDLGYLDLSNPRSSYPESKRFCEVLCVNYGIQYGVPVKIARLAQTFGVGTNRDDTRVFAQIARSAVARNDICLHTDGKSRGNYCDTSDAVRGLLTILLKGENGEAYNVAIPDASMTVGEMAELAAEIISGGKVRVNIAVPDDIEKRGYAPHMYFRLNADKLKALGWYPKYGLAQMYGHMVEDWKERHLI